jgi:hypothetical protein
MEKKYSKKWRKNGEKMEKNGEKIYKDILYKYNKMNKECPNCKKQFVRKADLIYHLDKKKKPCKPMEKNIPNIPENSINIPNIPENSVIQESDLNDFEIENEILIDSNNDLKCEFCLKCFSTKYNLNKHQRNICKKINNNKDISDELKMKDNQIGILVQKNEELQKLLIEETIEHKKQTIEHKKQTIQHSKQTTELHKMIMNLIKHETKKRNSLNSSNISNTNNGSITNMTNSNNTNNNTANINNGTVNNNNITIQFGKEDLSLIDNKHYLNLIQSKSNGANIITDLVKMIHFNEEYPQYQNVCMTDINRGKVVFFDGVKWNTITNGEKIIPELIEKAVGYSHEKDSELREGFKKNSRVINRMDTIKKHTKRCDTDYLEELKEDNYYGRADNKDKIADHEQFIVLVADRVKELIYNEKEVVLKKKNNTDNKKMVKQII